MTATDRPLHKNQQYKTQYLKKLTGFKMFLLKAQNSLMVKEKQRPLGLIYCICVSLNRTHPSGGVYYI